MGLDVAGHLPCRCWRVGEVRLVQLAGLLAHPGRLVGSVLGLILWIGLLAGAIIGLVGSPWRVPALMWVAGLVALGSVALVPAHLAAGVGGWRPAAGAVLGVLALVATLRMRPHPDPAGDQP